jgi:uncharacterized protein (TIGR02391 family)
MMALLERLRRLQEHILEVGLAEAVLSLPAPRMLALASPTSEGAGSVGVFVAAVTEFEILDVSRDLFASGHYSLAVQEAFKAVEKTVQDRANAHGMSGSALMENVFSEQKPKLFWSERATVSERDEQKGYQRLYAGAMLGIRNPVTHEFNWVEEPEVALELIVFAQHLLKKTKSAAAQVDAAAA